MNDMRSGVWSREMSSHNIWIDVVWYMIPEIATSS